MGHAAAFLLVLGIALAQTQPAHAETYNVPCGSIELVNALIDANDNEEEDFLWLAPGCSYSPLATLVVATDGGLPVTIHGNGAAVRGNHAFTVFHVSTDATLHLHQVSVIDAIATHGGGILNDGTLTLTDCTVTRNEADFGAGILNRGALRVETSLISGNEAAHGGGVYNDGGRLTLIRSTLLGNFARSGGAILNAAHGRARLVDSTLSGNRATEESGGGIYIHDGEVALSATTVSRNSAAVSGGGVFGTTSGVLRLENSILADSTGGGDCAAAVYTGSGANLIEDGSCVFAATLTGDPLLGELEGAPGHHPLSKGSPALDAGADASCPGVDQRGDLRPKDGNGDKTAVCDLGAYELGKKKGRK
jgi:predicted outer membrane repeat protein